MRHAALLATAVVLLLAPTATAQTVGADLDRPANNTRSCETGFYDPALILGTGFPYTPFATCTWWSVGGISGTGGTVVPYGGGTVRKVRVKVGPVTGRMQVVALRLIRHPGSLAEPGCCFPAGSGPVFTPEANGVTELDVDIPVRHEVDRASGLFNYDVLALSVLDAGVPMPAHSTGSSGFDGLVAGMFPHYAPGTERAVGHGTVMPGHVLLQADVEPPAKEEAVDRKQDEQKVDDQRKQAKTRGVAELPAPAAALAARTVKLRRGALAIPVTCTAPGGCAGEILVHAAPKAKKGRARAAAVKLLARGKVKLAAGAKGTVRAKLSRAGRRALRGRKKVAAIATLRLSGVTVATRRLTLRR
jgi:hypothetical protein